MSHAWSVPSCEHNISMANFPWSPNVCKLGPLGGRANSPQKPPSAHLFDTSLWGWTLTLTDCLIVNAKQSRAGLGTECIELYSIPFVMRPVWCLSSPHSVMHSFHASWAPMPQDFYPMNCHSHPHQRQCTPAVNWTLFSVDTIGVVTYGRDHCMTSCRQGPDSPAVRFSQYPELSHANSGALHTFLGMQTELSNQY